jgi:hypothetical protein
MRGTDHRCEGIVNGAPGARHYRRALRFGRGHARGPHAWKVFLGDRHLTREVAPGGVAVPPRVMGLLGDLAEHARR